MCVIIANYLSRKRFELVPICHQFMLIGIFLRHKHLVTFISLQH